MAIIPVSKLSGKKVATPTPNTKLKTDPNAVYKCTRCGKTRTDPKGYFFMSKTSPLFTANDLYTHICSDCVNEIFAEAQAKFKDTKLATIIVCHYLDVFFSEELYETTKDNANYAFGNYLKMMNGTQYKAKNFTTFLIGLIRDGIALKGGTAIQREKEVKWGVADTKNKNFVLQSVGYDCFDDESYTDANRKFLFNTLADYLTDDVLEDPHKLQCVIGMVKSHLQIESIDRLINSELAKAIPDHSLIKQLTESKSKVSSNINSTASDNGISAKGSSKGNRNGSSLTAIMKEMGENGFEEIKVNVVDAHLSASFKEVAEQNARALINELNFTSDEYARMLAEQSSLLSDAQERLLLQEEEIRKLRVENKRLSASGGED